MSVLRHNVLSVLRHSVLSVLRHNVLSVLRLTASDYFFGIFKVFLFHWILLVIDTYCIGSCKSNYHPFTTTTPLLVLIMNRRMTHVRYYRFWPCFRQYYCIIFFQQLWRASRGSGADEVQSLLDNGASVNYANDEYLVS